MTVHVYVDETKRAGYVLAAVTVPDPASVRKVIQGLVQPGNRRLHMVDERPRRRPGIVATLAATDIAVTIYDAARRYPTERDARAACLTALVEDLAALDGPDVRLVIEQDDSLVSFDNQRLIETTRATGQRDRLLYTHAPAHAEPLLALPDLAAWCWVRSGEWRRRIEPVLTAVRTV
ncbi:MAG: hypothetical protein ACT4QG_12450 [Sporichthyaceae bacterium]